MEPLLKTFLFKLHSIKSACFLQRLEYSSYCSRQLSHCLQRYRKSNAPERILLFRPVCSRRCLRRHIKNQPCACPGLFICTYCRTPDMRHPPRYQSKQPGYSNDVATFHANYMSTSPQERYSYLSVVHPTLQQILPAPSDNRVNGR